MMRYRGPKGAASTGFRFGRLAAIGLATAGLASANLTGAVRAATPDREMAEARSGALAGLSAIEQRPCPDFGTTDYVEGISDPAQLRAARASEFQYVRSSLDSLNRMAADSRLSAQGKQQLAALGSWNIATSLSNWTLLTIAEQAMVDPQVAAGAPFPLALIDGASSDAARLDLRMLAPEAAGAVQRMRSALARCASAGYQSLLTRNEDSFGAEVDRSRTNDELAALAARYQLSRAPQDPTVQAFQKRIESRRTQLAAMVRTPKAPPAGRPAAAPPAFTAQQMETTRRFLRAAATSNEQGALRELSDDVVMATPNGVYRGRSEVAAAVREQNANGRSGSMGEPFADSRGIAVRGRVSSFGVISRFSFNAANKINRINVSLN